MREADGEWLGRISSGRSRREVQRDNLVLTVELLEAGGVPYFAIPDEELRHTSIGIESEHRLALVEALSSAKVQPPIYLGIESVDAKGRTQRTTVSLQSNLGQQALLTQDSIEVFQLHVDRDGEQKFGRPDACRIDVWSRSKRATLRSDTKHQRGAEIADRLLVEDSVTVYGERLPSLAPLASTNIFEINEPIDVVYLWVDGQDEGWRQRRTATVEGITGVVTEDSIDPSRFRDNGELRYSMRSVFQHCDWVRNILLVTDSQIPDWLDASHPRIRMVDHQELFGESGELPSYNSHAITSRLHHLDGLSEQYLILNDDVFIGRDVGPSTFFLSNGMARFFLSRSTVPHLEMYAQAHEAARKNSIDLIQRDFGVAVSRNFFHTPVPQLRSLLFDLEDRYPKEFNDTWSHQVRSSDDYQINSWMHHYMGYLLKKTVPGAISYEYFSLDHKNLSSKLADLHQSRRRDTFCINDSSQALLENIEFLTEWLENYFPLMAPWEISSR